MQEDSLRGFKKFGFTQKGKTSSQVFGDCVFCAKENKLYINPLNQLWDCKVCSKRGNFQTFLGFIHEESLKTISKSDLLKLAASRSLPVDAFEGFKIGKYGNEFLIPVFNQDNKIQDLRSYRLGKRLMSAPGCSVGLYGLQVLNENVEKKVYLCEGEWDTIALNWLLKKINKPGICVGVPGAGTFKKEWIPFFKDKQVEVLYDNDIAGENGGNLVKERLTGCAGSLKYLYWPPELTQGYDVRDFIVSKAVGEKKPRGCFEAISKFLKDKPKKGSIVTDEIIEEAKKQHTFENIDQKVTLEDVFKTFEKWMHNPSRDAISLAIASVVSNELQGDPAWVFIVAPPGGSKTEILTAFDKCPNVYVTSSLTPHSLISGTSFKNGKDMSLIPQLDGKTLILKDFTSILGKREVEKDEIFGILRDAYDGKCGKVFGTGIHRYYSSHFSILSGVTPTIYELSSSYSGLGERFLKFFIGDNLVHASEEEIIRRAMRNVNKETSMRDEIAGKVYSYVGRICTQMRDSRFKLPDMSLEIENGIIACAQFIARMRALVSRDKFNTDVVLSKPSAEVGSRLGKQLCKLAYALAITNGRTSVTVEELRIIKKVTLDTISQRNEAIFRTIFKKCLTAEDSISTKDCSLESRYPFSTISRVLNDMDVLDVVKRVGSSKRAEWTVSQYMRDLIKRANLYTTEEELNRPIRKMILKKVQRKK